MNTRERNKIDNDWLNGSVVRQHEDSARFVMKDQLSFALCPSTYV